MGRWEIEGSTTSFTLACPSDPNIGSVNFPIWTQIDLDHGVLSDLADVSNVCVPPGINFSVDSKGITATAMDPDPYTMAAPLCELVIGSDTNGNPVYIDFSFSSLTFTKLADSGTGKAPRALFSGSASGPEMLADASGNYSSNGTCTYSGSGDIFHRTTRP
jgi:hypothetical protein